ncbi:MAG: trypsin-like peptidase domain-containing protein [Magnetococcales bacterium]|nr:trypsin-like peptidase domain-containing protein [Magnetococcales bacterium]
MKNLTYFSLIALLVLTLSGCESALSVLGSTSYVSPFNIPHIEPGTPLPIPEDNKPTPIKISKLFWDIPRGRQILAMHGGYYKDTNIICNPSRLYQAKIRWGTGNYKGQHLEPDMVDEFRSTLNDLGYDVVGKSSVMFNRQKEYNRAKISVGARIKKILSNACTMYGYLLGDPLYETSIITHMEVEWVFYDSLNKKTLLTLTTSSTNEHRVNINAIADVDGVNEEVNSHIISLFGHNAARLTEYQEFVDLMMAGKADNDDEEWEEDEDTEEIDDDETVKSETKRKDQKKKNRTIQIKGVEKSKHALENNVATTQDSVVTILAPNGGHGSGFVIDPRGYILSNHHVAGDTGTKVKVRFYSGMEMDAKVIRSHEKRDVALLKIKGASNLPSLHLREEIALPLEKVFALGSPSDPEMQGTISDGIVSTLRIEKDTNYPIIQANCDVYPGNSGGPLVDKDGNVVGIAVRVYIGDMGEAIAHSLFIPITDALKRLKVRYKRP